MLGGKFFTSNGHKGLVVLTWVCRHEQGGDSDNWPVTSRLGLVSEKPAQPKFTKQTAQNSSKVVTSAGGADLLQSVPLTPRLFQQDH